MPMKVRELIKLLESKQWRQVRQKGSHRAFRHPLKALVVTVPGNRNDDVPIGTLKSILRKAEIEAP
jgi:predicted RNA binding protein YcfA (HicA-like mRNA interferase family)